MDFKTILITGATSGIGLSTLRTMAGENYRIVFTARNETKAQRTLDRISRESGNDKIHYIIGDLSEGSGVKNVADEFKSHYDRLDILINNAGGYFHEKMKTSEGYEYTFALNHLAYFGLPLLLMDVMKKSQPARIINVASEASRYGHIDFEDLMANKKYSGVKAYCQSKLANLLFTYELARKLDGAGITVNAVHPGAVRTNFGHTATGVKRFLFNLYVPFMRTPEKGAETVIYLAESEDVKGVSGKYFHDKKEISSIRESYDPEIARRLWKKSLDLTHLGLYDIREN